jgi:uncharacterized protein
MHDHKHPEIVKRLKRADGHLQKIIEMIEGGKPCSQVAQQLQAVESAIESAKKALIHDHIARRIEGTLKAPGKTGRAAMREFQSIARYL